MNKLQELMVITMEECGELTQSCSKVIRKFENFEEITGEKRDKLIEEAGDVACMIELMVELGICTESEIQNRIQTKREKLKKWSKLFE
jgi:NTP pyrophosphatase (non-canonical NTP hydrolase)